MSPTQVIVIVLVVLVVAAVLAVVARQAARRRALRSRFGPEYDRVVAERDSRADAERELRERERRHAELTLTPLTPESRARYAAAWEELQVRFVDSPAETVSDADELVGRLVAERGYPTGDFSDQIAQLSVEHARTLSHYRDAHEIRLRNERGEAGTEELRQAVVHYRALFADLLGGDPLDARVPDQRDPDQHHPEHRRPEQHHRPEQRHPEHASREAQETPVDRPHDVTSR
ncbi:hypothetical protein [Micromonospora sp. WMMD712]|uniref:hypothetical protein n=1 Tax=Micromonospora sp. WMMD712 TaxID=3016096 RepID=UPI002499FE6E|nr:hypothetical protein [Micromonospora sp. WMMD712]WFE57703.1 hypothetical protein O7633_12910 [Micromonospora sp. WMMD712]